jgi:curved DNA-binding protein CbpA
MMMINDQATFYDVLDLRPDATPEEIREAYLRTKATYSKDSVALYTLVSQDETKDMLRRIEEAYEILSNPDRRRDYDRNHGLLSLDRDQFTPPSRIPASKKIISIDRTPPMESLPDGDSLLVAPSTDFGGNGRAGEGLRGGFEGADPFALPAATAPQQTGAQPRPDEAVARQEATPPAAPRNRDSAEAALALEISAESDWRGAFLRKVREARRVSIEEMSSITKVSKTYLLAIEDENFPKLPAPVFLRGFVIQVAKVLRLPGDKVAAAYMARYYQARPDKAH